MRNLVFGMATAALVISAPQLALAKGGGGGTGPTLGGHACASGDITPGAQACTGWYTGNLDGGSPTDNADTAVALNTLLGVSTFTATNFTVLSTLSNLPGNSEPNAVDFSVPMYGETVISFHVGAAKGSPTGVGYQATAFYEFDAGNLVGGLQSILFNIQGLSNARLYSTGTYQGCTGDCGGGGGAVPEPATWALMLIGVGCVGAGARMRRRDAIIAA